MPSLPAPRVAVIGGGPAGLMAAETARAAGCEVDVFEAKGSVGRKFLIAGKGGLNLTHGEPRRDFERRFAGRQAEVAGWLADFDADALREWARGLGVDTFVGSSGRVFPTDLKAAPLLRGWVRRLREQGVRFHVSHRWRGPSDDGVLRFDTPDEAREYAADATILALGGGSWPQLGSDGAWAGPLAAAGVDVAPLLPSNCGFDVDWTAFFRQHFAGAPIKPVRLAIDEGPKPPAWRQGECVASEHGIEGSLIYALSAALRDRLAATGAATLLMDLAPGRERERLQAELSRPRKGRSQGEHLRRSTGLDGVKAALLREVLGKDGLDDAATVAANIKCLPLKLRRPRPIAEAISSAGGIRLEGLDERMMLRSHPGLFAAGEMLDWEAPTGGYLLTACFASGRRAGAGAAQWLRLRAPAAR
ncbi:MAG TPA: TIGR03862 family flavoprotein [Arenimonas sp.]|uniref:TIGR03862 family flavoprotein n=1 Tax=Arenimonas sp. TaxID=1872635 RepID=UPI002D7FC31C|nr:TIGR03862 family flavoprotein [Arenimonas sp.]HEU0151986.1 TIGR03862 family flavoprotein [Arenimonas sp.]